MYKTMRFPFDQRSINAAFGELDRELLLRNNPDGIELLTANSLWPHKDFVFLEAFIEIARKQYHSDVFPVDYSDAEAVRLQINGWVEGKTKEKIKNLIPPGVLNPLTRMVLVNAIYFKGNWQVPFDPALTVDRPFFNSDGSKADIPTMYGKIASRFAELPTLKILDLPYMGDAISMMIALPNDINGLAELEKSITPEILTSWDKALHSEEVQVYLPRFSLTDLFGLSKTLAGMGMPDAFDEAKANFSGMDGNEHNLFISDVIHKAFVDVNEKGTEAAAATAVIMQARSMPKPAPEFRADHPFLFIIKDRETQSILFMGRLNAPPAVAAN